MSVTIIPLASSQDEAFSTFRKLVFSYVITGLGVPLEVDFGNYVHVFDPQKPDYEYRLAQIPWIAPTVTKPDEIWQVTIRRKGRLPSNRIYFIKAILSSKSEKPKTFLVITEPIGNRLRLKTWFDTTEDYMESQIRKRGERI